MDRLKRLFSIASSQVQNKAKSSLQHLNYSVNARGTEEELIDRVPNQQNQHYFGKLKDFFSNASVIVAHKARNSVQAGTLQLKEYFHAEKQPSEHYNQDKSERKAISGLKKFFVILASTITEKQTIINHSFERKLKQNQDQIEVQRIQIKEEPAEIIYEQIAVTSEKGEQNIVRSALEESQPQIPAQQLNIQGQLSQNEENRDKNLPSKTFQKQTPHISKLGQFFSLFSAIIVEKMHESLDNLNEKIKTQYIPSFELTSPNQIIFPPVPIQPTVKSNNQFKEAHSQYLHKLHENEPNQNLIVTNSFPATQELIASNNEQIYSIESKEPYRKMHRRHESQRKASKAAQMEDQNIEQFGYKDESDHQLQSYVEQQRLSKIKDRVNKLKKEYLVTENYDASDQQDPEESNNDHRYKIMHSKVIKHKTEHSSNVYKLYQPKIYVQEPPATQRKVSSSLKVHAQQLNWPETQPKKKKVTKNSLKKMSFGSPISSISPQGGKFSINLQSQRPQYYEKIIRLKEAKRKKLNLQRKLEQINKQISEIKAVQRSIEHSKSPKNSIKEMINISDDRDARLKAMSLVRRMRKQRDKRQKVVTNIFSKVDQEIVNNISELSRLRAEQDKKQKEKKKLQVLERMREQERRKLQQYKLQSANLHFLNALKSIDTKKSHYDRRSLAWIKATDLPELAIRKDILERLRNLSYMEKRSLIQDYNRELLKKT